MKVEKLLLYCHKSRLERQTKRYVWGNSGMLTHRVFEIFETRKDCQTHSEEQTFRCLVAIAHSQATEITKAGIACVCFREVGNLFFHGIFTRVRHLDNKPRIVCAILVVTEVQTNTEVEKTTSSTNQCVDFEGDCNPIAHVGVVVENRERRGLTTVAKTNAISYTFVAVKTSIIAHGEGVGDATKFSIYSVLRLFFCSHRESDAEEKQET